MNGMVIVVMVVIPMRSLLWMRQWGESSSGGVKKEGKRELQWQTRRRRRGFYLTLFVSLLKLIKKSQDALCVCVCVFVGEGRRSCVSAVNVGLGEKKKCNPPKLQAGLSFMWKIIILSLFWLTHSLTHSFILPAFQPSQVSICFSMIQQVVRVKRW